MKKRILIAFLSLSILGFLFSFTTPGERYFEIARNLDIFASLFKEVNTLYVDEVNPNTLVKTGIDAMLESLDPYTNYIPENMVEDFRKQNTGQYDGIGIMTREIENRTMISMIMDGFVAQQAGLKIGDEILKIDNVDLSKLTSDEEGQLMKGQVGTPVKLTIKRLGTPEPFVVECKREKIKVSNLPYFGMLENNIGFIQLSEFTPEAGKEVKNAVVSLKEQGANGIILDLRGNPGGLLMEAVNICNIFIPRGKLVVSTKGKLTEQNQKYETLNAPIDTEIPVAVLINRTSASASEIVAGTLQDYDRAVIVGEKSYGKGLVQIPRQLPYNSQLKVTTAKYYTPTGRCIQVLDYTHRREDGSVGSIPDSLKKPFKTLVGGRTVYDGGGIDPDVNTNPTLLHPLAQQLYQSGLLFDYATHYCSTRPAISDARSFSLTNEEYNQFAAWIKTKNYSYSTELDKQLAQLEAEASQDKNFNELKPQLDQLAAKVKESKKNEIFLYKDQIKRLLEEEIASRYYLARGIVEVNFKYDDDIKKSVAVLVNQQEYKKILRKQ